MDTTSWLVDLHKSGKNKGILRLYSKTRLDYTLTQGYFFICTCYICKCVINTKD